MSDKDESLRLADKLDAAWHNMIGGSEMLEGAAMLRSQHARIAELEAELAEQCRINGMGSEREAKHLTRIAELEAVGRDVALTSLSALNRVRELERVARVALEALELAEDLIASEWGEPDPLDKNILTIESLRKALGEA